MRSWWFRCAARAAGGAAILLGAAVLIAWPWTSPIIIHAKTMTLGPRLTYGSLAFDDERWEIVVAGVKSGEPKWLRVAIDLKPVLDTHPGEEMLEAVASAFEGNPRNAIRILIPVYGAPIVCGLDENGPVSAQRAAQRLRLLESLRMQQAASPEVEACAAVLRGLKGHARDAQKDARA
jgi:hypothetical protein